MAPDLRICRGYRIARFEEKNRTSRERFAITCTELRRQGSAFLKICNGQKGAHGAGGYGAPPPYTAGNRTRNTKKPPPRGGRPREIPHSEEIGALPKKTNPERGSLLAGFSGTGRYAQQPPRWACLSIVGAPLPMGKPPPHMQAAPPPKPDGIRREAESGRPASCRISIPAGPTTALSG